MLCNIDDNVMSVTIIAFVDRNLMLVTFFREIISLMDAIVVAMTA